MSPWANDREMERLALLMGQLPKGSRLVKSCVVQEDPNQAWTDEQWTLWSIDNTCKWIAYGLAGGKGKKPKPIPTPKEQARKTLDEQSMAETMLRLDEVFGPIGP